MDFSKIKKLAKDLGVRVSDLIVLAQQNDPFYIGSPSQLRAAEWFADIWRNFDYEGGIHLRRIHYQIVSQDPPLLLPGNEPYRNIEGHWQFLNRASCYARYLYMVDPGDFDDRRNNKPQIFVPTKDGTPTIGFDYNFDEDGFKLPEFPEMPGYYVEDFEVDQRYQIEVWSEKSTMNDILLPLCEEMEVNLITGTGEISITHACWLMDRLKNSRKPCRIFYISDFDPAGKSMPVAASRKIEKFIYDRGGGHDVNLFPLVLTEDQCQKYRLPRTPIKDSERRAQSFEERFGEGATELDALEAVYPGELAKILTAAISNYRDFDLEEKVNQAAENIEIYLDEIRDEVLAARADEIIELKREHRLLSSEFESRFQDLNHRLKNLRHAIISDLEDQMPDISDFSIPEPDHAIELESPLFDSDRDYFQQLVEYKRFQGKDHLSDGLES